MGQNLSLQEIKYRLAAYTFYTNGEDHPSFTFDQLKADIPIDYINTNIQLNEFQNY